MNWAGVTTALPAYITTGLHLPSSPLGLRLQQLPGDRTATTGKIHLLSLTELTWDQIQNQWEQREFWIHPHPNCSVNVKAESFTSLEQHETIIIVISDQKTKRTFSSENINAGIKLYVLKYFRRLLQVTNLKITVGSVLHVRETRRRFNRSFLYLHLWLPSSPDTPGTGSSSAPGRFKNSTKVWIWFQK